MPHPLLVRRRRPTPLPLRRRATALRRLLARRPWVYWLIVVALAGAAGALSHRRMAALADAREAWGDTVPVLVARRPLAPGDPLAGNVDEVRWPAALVPSGRAAGVPAGAVARRRVSAGFPLAGADVAARPAPLGLVPDGWLAAPLVESPRSGADVGDRVRVVADGVAVAPEALVVGFVGDATLVATPADAAPLVALADASGQVTLLRVP